MHKIVNFNHGDRYRIHLYFEDGFNASIDFEPFLQKGFARELLDKESFREVFIESGGGLAWKNGFDFCPNFLYELSAQQTLEHA